MALSRDELIALQHGGGVPEKKQIVAPPKVIRPVIRREPILRPYLDIVAEDIRSIRKKFRAFMKVITRKKRIDEEYQDFMEQFFPGMKS